jgi:hypothetical protein
MNWIIYLVIAAVIITCIAATLAWIVSAIVSYFD